MFRLQLVGYLAHPLRVPPAGPREGDRIATPETPLAGDEMLDAINDELFALHQRYHHRKPVTAKTQLLQNELLSCVMGGVYTDVEKTMIELQRSAQVRDTRSAFQQTMHHQFVEVVERLTGRTVEAFISTSSVGPDIEVELFVLAPPRRHPESHERGVAAAAG